MGCLLPRPAEVIGASLLLAIGFDFCRVSQIAWSGDDRQGCLELEEVDWSSRLAPESGGSL